MTEAKVREIIREVIADSTEAEKEITDETRIIEDLGLSSMEVMILVGDLENELGIEIPVSKISNANTVRELSNILISIIKNSD